MFPSRAAQISGQTRRFERHIREDWVVVSPQGNHPVTLAPMEHGFEVTYQDAIYRVTTDWRIGDPIVAAEVNGRLVNVQVDRQGASYRIFHGGTQLDVMVVTPNVAALNEHMIEKEAPDMSRFLLSPMPGLLVRLAVSEGEEVKAGEELAVVEAMKMENSLRAEDDVVVAKVLAQEGASLDVDQPILEFE